MVVTPAEVRQGHFHTASSTYPVRMEGSDGALPKQAMLKDLALLGFGVDLTMMLSASVSLCVSSVCFALEWAQRKHCFAMQQKGSVLLGACEGSCAAAGRCP